VEYGELYIYFITQDNTHLMAMSQSNAGKPVPECLHSEFYWSKDDGGVIQQKRIY